MKYALEYLYNMNFKLFLFHFKIIANVIQAPTISFSAETNRK